MEKRILLVALLIVPMGIALARYEEVSQSDTYSGRVTTGGDSESEVEAYIRTGRLPGKSEVTTGKMTTGSEPRSEVYPSGQ